VGVAAGALELLGRGEGAGQAHRQRAGAAVQAAAQEAGEGVPGVAVVGQGGLGLGDVAAQAVQGQPLEELLLAAVAAVQGGDTDAGLGGDGGDRGLRVGGEHRPGGLQDALVVAGRLGPAAAHRLGRRLHEKHLITGTKRSILL
jgi:hypothetical protein